MKRVPGIPRTSAASLNVVDLGRMPYREAWSLQQKLFDRRAEGQIEDTLLLVEHPSTVTIGRSGGNRNLLASAESFETQGIEVLEIDRGGDVTYHGPGQVVGYPILDLSTLMPDLHRYVRSLEDVMIRTLRAYGLTGERIPGLTGVWVEGEKVGAIGVRVKRWITMHGFALNVNTDLAGFDMIVPCGLQGRAVTSLERLLGHAVDLQQARDRVAACFASVFGLTPRRVRRPQQAEREPRAAVPSTIEIDSEERQVN